MEPNTQTPGSAVPQGLMTNERFAKIALHISQVALYLLQGEDALYAEVRPIYENFKAKALSAGYSVALLSTFRTFDYQDKLYAQGRTAEGNIVTNAQGGQSYHNYGLAFDIEPTRQDGQTIQQADWATLGQIGEEVGLVWGGTFEDYDHFEWHDGFTWNDLINIFSRADDAQ